MSPKYTAEFDAAIDSELGSIIDGIVSDIEKCADRVMVIKEGKKVFDGMEEETGKDLEAFYLNIFGGEE